MDVCSHVGFWPVGLLHCMSSFMALFRLPVMSALAPLVGAKRTSARELHRSDL